MMFKLTALTWGVRAVIIVFALGVVDWQTGYELNFFVFYFLPVSIGAWFLGFVGAVSFAILSSGVWFGADILAGHTYTSHFFAVWNTLVRLVSFLAMGWSVSRVRVLLDHEREVTESLRNSLSQITIVQNRFSNEPTD